MVRTYVSKPGKRPYRNYSDEDLNRAASCVQENKMTFRQASEKFKIPVGTISNYLSGKHKKRPGHPTVFTQAEEFAFVQHLNEISKWGFPIDTFDLRVLIRDYLSLREKKVKQFVNNLPGEDWASAFLRRHKDEISLRKCQNIKRSRAAVSAESVNQFFHHFIKTVEGKGGDDVVTPDRIYNYDETNLSDNPGTKKCIFKRSVKYPERIMNYSKGAISLMFSGSASGVMLPCYVVYKADHLWDRWTEGGPAGTRYNRTKSGWFDSTAYTDWFSKVFLPAVRRQEGRKIIIGDNLSSHFTEDVLRLADEHNIEFVCFPANSTHLMQPLDVAFFAPMKRIWRKILESYKLSAGSDTLSKDRFPGLLSSLCKELYAGSKSEINQNMISGFRTCGLAPLEPEKVLSKLPDGKVEESPRKTSSNVSQVVVDMLKRMRGVDSADKKPRKKKRLDVPPGQSISYEEFLKSLEGPSTEPAETSKAGNDGQVDDPETDESDESEDESESELPMHMDMSSVSVGQFVVVNYEGSEFPGSVKSVEETGAVVSVMQKCIKHGWKWPNQRDELLYCWEDILRPLNDVKEKKRGMFEIPELDAWLY